MKYCNIDDSLSLFSSHLTHFSPTFNSTQLKYYTMVTGSGGKGKGGGANNGDKPKAISRSSKFLFSLSLTHFHSISLSLNPLSLSLHTLNHYVSSQPRLIGKVRGEAVDLFNSSTLSADSLPFFRCLCSSSRSYFPSRTYRTSSQEREVRSTYRCRFIRSVEHKLKASLSFSFTLRWMTDPLRLLCSQSTSLLCWNT